jgi:hypothetical protein
MVEDPTIVRAESVATPQVQANKPPAHGARQRLGRFLGGENNAAAAAQREEQAEVFRVPLRKAYQEITEGRNMAELMVGPHKFGSYTVRYFYGGLESTRPLNEPGKMETMMLAPEAGEVFVRTIETSKDGVVVHVDRSTYDSTGNAVVENGDVGPTRKNKPIHTGWKATAKHFEQPESSISDGTALANLVKAVKAAREAPRLRAEAERRTTENTRRRELAAARRAALQSQQVLGEGK